MKNAAVSKSIFSTNGHALFSLREGEKVNIPLIYEQALSYAKLLYQLPYEVYRSNLIELRIPEWVKTEALSKT